MTTGESDKQIQIGKLPAMKGLGGSRMEIAKVPLRCLRKWWPTTQVAKVITCWERYTIGRRNTKRRQRITTRHLSEIR